MKENRTTRGQPGKAAIDWGELRRRLERGRAALEQGAAPAAEKAKQILRARAEELARESPKTPAPQAFLEVVAFQLANETYALETSWVREVYPLKEFTPLPGTPPFVLGLINARGELLAVIDIKKFYDLPEEGLTDLNKVIVVASEGMQLGILADVVLGVQSVPVESLQPSLPTLTGIRAEYLRGVTRERVVVLDAGKLLSRMRIAEQEEVKPQFT